VKDPTAFGAGAPYLGMVNRKDFGMAWNEVIEAGGVLVGDEVEIVLDVEAVPAK
jgi:polyisoprenoid-binding protein YceI